MLRKINLCIVYILSVLYKFRKNIFTRKFIHLLFILYIYVYVIAYSNKDDRYGIKYVKNYNEDLFILELKTKERFYLRKKNIYADICPITETFITNTYYKESIINDIKGKIVIDIGANIGDTAVFFAEYGGIVYAYEPSIDLHNAAVKNILLNNLKVNLISAGVGSENKKCRLSTSKTGPDMSSKTIFDDREVQCFEEVKIIKFSDILNNFQSIYLLKMDCEGCEFEAFKSIKNNELQKVEHFIIEYHFKQPDQIIKLLKENSFNVIIKEGEIGFIYADKIQLKDKNKIF